MALTQNYKFAKFGLETEICSDFYEIWHSEQIKHATILFIIFWNFTMF